LPGHSLFCTENKVNHVKDAGLAAIKGAEVIHVDTGIGFVRKEGHIDQYFWFNFEPFIASS
jgi:hypothetical protein